MKKQEKKLNKRGEPPGKKAIQVDQSNKVFKITIIIQIIIVIVCLFISVSYLLISTLWVKRILVGIIAVFGVFDVVWFFVFKSCLKDIIKYLGSVFKGKTKGKCPRPKALQIVSASLCVLILASVTVFNAAVLSYDKDNNSGPDSKSNKKFVKNDNSAFVATTPDTVVDKNMNDSSEYNLLDSDSCCQYYFPNEYDTKALAATLEKSIYKLQNQNDIKVVSDSVLNSSEKYGSKASSAVMHNILLHNIISDRNICIVNGPVPVYIYKYIIRLRKEMDDAYITPENSFEIANMYILGAEKGLEVDRVFAYEQALKYTWRSFLANYVWGEYSEDDISLLQERYNKLATVNKSESEHLNFINRALDSLKKRLD